MRLYIPLRKAIFKTLPVFLLGSCMLCCSKFSTAQQSHNLSGFGLGLEGGVSPDLSKTQFVNLSVTARYSFHAGPGYVYVGTGFMVSRVATDFQIPIRVGYKWFFSKQFFLTEELGYYFYRNAQNHYPYDGSTIHGLSIASSVGIQFGSFELGLRYDALINQGDFSTIGFMLGWNF